MLGVIEGVSTGYSAYVPELPTVLVTGRSVEELIARAAEAIRLYLSVLTSPPHVNWVLGYITLFIILTGN